MCMCGLSVLWKCLPCVCQSVFVENCFSIMLANIFYCFSEMAHIGVIKMSCFLFSSSFFFPLSLLPSLPLSPPCSFSPIIPFPLLFPFLLSHHSLSSCGSFGMSTHMQCEPDCHDGVRVRKVLCREVPGNVLQPDNECAPPKPQTTEQCVNRGPCFLMPQWGHGDWSKVQSLLGLILLND